MKRLIPIVTAISFATAMGVAANAMAAVSHDPGARIASQYATWAGGRSNSDAIVNGLRTGNSITLVTAGPNNTKSIAGFTAQTTMTPDEIAGALAAAKRTLSSLGIHKPTAEQIQVALIGGEITPAGGKAKLVQGSVALRAEPVPVSAVATR